MEFNRGERYNFVMATKLEGEKSLQRDAKLLITITDRGNLEVHEAPVTITVSE